MYDVFNQKSPRKKGRKVGEEGGREQGRERGGKKSWVRDQNQLIAIYQGTAKFITKPSTLI